RIFGAGAGDRRSVARAHGPPLSGHGPRGGEGAPRRRGQGRDRGHGAPVTTPANGQLAVSVWVRLLKTHGLVLRELRRRVPDALTLPQFDVLVQLHRRPAGVNAPG